MQLYFHCFQSICVAYEGKEKNCNRVSFNCSLNVAQYMFAAAFTEVMHKRKYHRQVSRPYNG
uniref:Uncharacterized protein n=1 Tax=Anguilla anguilla TaxID=7936 RepID=A0A0E9SS08_ANGAN